VNTPLATFLCGAVVLLIGLLQYRDGEPSTLLLISGAFIIVMAVLPRRRQKG